VIVRARTNMKNHSRSDEGRGQIAFGTDMGGIPWTEPIATEFNHMVKFGMSPMDAIKSATSKAADLLR